MNRLHHEPRPRPNRPRHPHRYRNAQLHGRRYAVANGGTADFHVRRLHHNLHRPSMMRFPVAILFLKEIGKCMQSLIGRRFAGSVVNPQNAHRLDSLACTCPVIVVMSTTMR
jgi:hypothetical protein